MQQLSAAVRTGLENAQKGRNIDLQPFNPVTQQGTSLEVIQCYKVWLSRENFYTSTEMALFNNELTEDGAGNQQDQ